MSAREDIQAALKELEQLIASRAPTAPPELIQEFAKATQALVDFGVSYDHWLAAKVPSGAPTGLPSDRLGESDAE